MHREVCLGHMPIGVSGCCLASEEWKRANDSFCHAVQDLAGSLGPSGIASELGLGKVDTRPHRVQPVSAHHGMGILDGLQWIVTAVKSSSRLSLLRKRARGL